MNRLYDVMIEYLGLKKKDEFPRSTICLGKSIDNNVGGVAIESTQLLAEDSQFRCTVCGQIGTVGRCCGLDTREPLNDLALAELAAEEQRNANVTGERPETRSEDV